MSILVIDTIISQSTVQLFTNFIAGETPGLYQQFVIVVIKEIIYSISLDKIKQNPVDVLTHKLQVIVLEFMERVQPPSITYGKPCGNAVQTRQTNTTEAEVFLSALNGMTGPHFVIGHYLMVTLKI